MPIYRRILGAACLCTAMSLSAEAPKPTVEVVTSVGSMTLELWPEQAPQTVDNFLKLVDDGFYVGTIFHRVIAGFMIQCGGYEADLTYRQAPRKVANESANGLRNQHWTVAMARHSDPDSADSQFYINLKDNAHLDAREGQPGYTVFGVLIAGRDVAETIEFMETGVVQGTPNVPLEPVVIQAVRRVDTVDADDQPTVSEP